MTQLAVKWHHPLLLNDSLWYSAQAVVLANGRRLRRPLLRRPERRARPAHADRARRGELGRRPAAVAARRDDRRRHRHRRRDHAARPPPRWLVGGHRRGVDRRPLPEPVDQRRTGHVRVAGHAARGRRRVVRPRRRRRRRRAGRGRPRAGWRSGWPRLTRSELVLLLPIVVVVVACGPPARGTRGRDGRVHGRWCRRRAGAVGRGQPRALRPAGAAHHERRHDAARRQLRRQLRRLRHRRVVAVLRAGRRRAAGRGSRPCDRTASGSSPVRYAADHLGRVPVVAAARDRADVRRRRRAATWCNGDVGEERPEWASWVGIVSFWVLAVLAVVGFRRLARAVAMGAAGAGHQRAGHRHRCSTAPTGSGRRPSRRSSSPPGWPRAGWPAVGRDAPEAPA